MTVKNSSGQESTNCTLPRKGRAVPNPPINCVGWGPKFPRLTANNQLSAATYKASNFPGFRFMNVADIICDINGGLEFSDKSLSAPCYDFTGWRTSATHDGSRYFAYCDPYRCVKALLGCALPIPNYSH